MSNELTYLSIVRKSENQKMIYLKFYKYYLAP